MGSSSILINEPPGLLKGWLTEVIILLHKSWFRADGIFSNQFGYEFFEVLKNEGQWKKLKLKPFVKLYVLRICLIFDIR